MAPESSRWEDMVCAFAARVERAGYGLLVSPMFEESGVFVRGMGESTEVAGKEMYEFEDKGGRSLALRPEGTASVVRAFVQNRPPVPWKVWYVTPAFRYERPQAGRYRQHHQLGVEALGTADPGLDVEVLDLATAFCAGLGLCMLELRLNSMGDFRCRPAYLEALAAYLEGVESRLCGEHRRSWRSSPLRVLDCKTPECRSATEGAPRLLDGLCDECREHFGRVESGLSALGIAYSVDHRLVRGFDYYTRTTFELVAKSLEAAQNGVGGGGRYDGLAEALGGPPTPGIGFGVGVERLLLACDAEGVFGESGRRLEAFVVDTTGGDAAVALTHELREAGIAAGRAYDSRSLKAQLKAADRSGAAVALIVGPDEASHCEVTLRPLRSGAGQERVDRDKVVERVRQAVQR
jgi:histidyl-tRNA synthetase